MKEVARNYREPEMPKNPGGTHQPIVICIDTSYSMTEKAEDGRKKYEIVQELVNGLANLELKGFDKDNIDICILVFDDEVRTLVDWRSLSSFEGGIELDVAGCTSLGTAVLTAIDKTRERRADYHNRGIECKRPQIFVYTDGASTEPLDAAYKVAQDYLNREKPSAKMYITLIPPATDPSELMDFGEAVTIMLIKECVNGLPAAFKFMEASVVAASQSVLGADTKVEVPKDIGVLPRGGTDGFTSGDGQKTVETNTWVW